MTIQTGTFGTALLTANAAVAVCSNNGTTAAVCNVNFCNANSITANVTLAISSAASLSSAQTAGAAMDTGTPVAPNTPYERTGRPIAPGETVWALSNINSVSVQVYGIVSAI